MLGIRETTVTRREPLHRKVCPVCGTQFVGIGRRRYCATSCVQRASYARHADDRRRERRERYRRQGAAGGGETQG
jgi:hypothetical protein